MEEMPICLLSSLSVRSLLPPRQAREREAENVMDEELISDKQCACLC